MPDLFRRTTIADPRMIQSAVSEVLRPGELRLPNYRGTESRSYQPADRRAFQCDPKDYLTSIGVAHIGSLRAASIGDRRGTVCVILEPGLPAYCLCLVQRGSARLRSPGHKELADIGHGAGAIYAGTAGTSFASSDDNQRLTVWIPSTKLRDCLESLVERPITQDIAFEPAVDMSAGAGASLRNLLNHLERELAHPDSLISRRIATTLFEDLLCMSIVQGLRHNHSEWLTRPYAAGDLRSVKRAEDFIHAHLRDPVTVRDLARAAGCGVRSLQMAFHQVRGMAPMAALQQARLAQARRDLACGDESVSVTDVALRFGFNHPGRFAQMYWRAFGERPLQTLRERRR